MDAKKPTKVQSKSTLSLATVISYILVIAGIVGLICSFIITDDKIKLLQNPSYIPSCNLNPIISCGNVMQSKQSGVFGFPNSFIGLAAFAIILCVGMAIRAGATFKRWFWIGLELGTIFGLGFVHWLFFESVYRIHSLCPYCMVVWVTTITTFWYVTLYNIDQKHIVLPKTGSVRTAYGWVRRHHLDILILWFIVIAALILKHFWYYYGKHI